MYIEAKAATIADRKRGLLARLRTDTGGNVIAMTAAAMFPLLGLVGGAIDMGRLYAVKSRLQAACDAGALGGRRVMGAGRWTDNSGRANTIAQSTFDLNFESGAFGSTNPSRSFVENDGTVTGNASADVPMTLMSLFDAPTKSISVTCDGQMRIPNTDVMFVVDNSGSMAQVIPGDTTGQTKINGLKIAVKCFYEALAKINIDDVTPGQCGTTTDPSGGISSQIQLRFGFVPYDHMVNVGKLLPNTYLVDSNTYQSRQANTQTLQAWTLGTASSITYGSYAPSGPPPSMLDANNYGSWLTLGTSGNTAVNNNRTSNISFANKRVAVDAATCAANNIYAGSGNSLVAVGESQASATTTSTNPTPVYPDNVQDIDNTNTQTQTMRPYRYRWFYQGAAFGCYLEKANNTNTYDRVRTGPSTKPIAWTAYQNVQNWTYKPVAFDVSSLKAGGSSWNGSISLPLNVSNGSSVKLSGSTTSTTIRNVSNASVLWKGCIEERQTFQNTDGNGADDWNYYPTTPAEAYDMDIDRAPDPSDPTTQWRPALNGAVWGRQATLLDDPATTGIDETNVWRNGWALANVTSPDYRTNSSTNLSSNSCVVASRKMQTYNNAGGATDFKTYVNTLAPNGNTYHDIGLLWGARLMSPTGIFGSENATTPLGAQITRHLIFMTDGDTANTENNYTSYGIDWWDRRQFDVGATAAQLEANNNARANALCTAIKNKNITLWVVSYGNGVNATTATRLRGCASGSAFYFNAVDTTALVTKFRQIAEQIADLRLTG